MLHHAKDMCGLIACPLCNPSVLPSFSIELGYNVSRSKKLLKIKLGESVPQNAVFIKTEWYDLIEYAYYEVYL